MVPLVLVLAGAVLYIITTWCVACPPDRSTAIAARGASDSAAACRCLLHRRTGPQRVAAHAVPVNPQMFQGLLASVLEDGVQRSHAL